LFAGEVEFEELMTIVWSSERTNFLFP